MKNKIGILSFILLISTCSCINQIPSCRSKIKSIVNNNWKLSSDGKYYITSLKIAEGVNRDSCLKNLTTKDVLKIFGNPQKQGFSEKSMESFMLYQITPPCGWPGVTDCTHIWIEFDKQKKLKFF